MGRAALRWSAADLARESGVGYATIARFELGQAIQADNVALLRRALEAGGCRFLMSGPHKGAVVPPAPQAIEDRSAGNPTMPR